MLKKLKNLTGLSTLLLVIVTFLFPAAACQKAHSDHDDARTKNSPVFRISGPELNVEERTITFNFRNTNDGVSGDVYLYVFLVASTGDIIPIGRMSGEDPLAVYTFDGPHYFDGQEINRGIFSRRIKKDVRLDLLQSLVIRMSYTTYIIGENQEITVNENKRQVYNPQHYTVGYKYNLSANIFNLMPQDQLEEAIKPISEAYPYMMNQRGIMGKSWCARYQSTLTTWNSPLGRP